MDNALEKTSPKLERDENGRLLPNQKSLNPNGRPVGSISPIGRVKQIFEENPEEFEEFIRKYLKDPNNRKHIVEMIDGSPKGAGNTLNVGIAINQTPLTDEQRAEYSIEIVNKLMGSLVEIKDGKVVRK
jgi:hypothetical protein